MEAERAMAGDGRLSNWAPTVEMRFRGSFGMRPGEPASMERYRQALDAACWSALAERAGLRDIMGKRQRDMMRAALKAEAPEFTVGNVRATFGRFGSESRAILQKTLVDVFETLDSSYARHDQVKIGPRIIHANSVEWSKHSKSWGWWCGEGRDALTDLDRIAHRFDRLPFEMDAFNAIEAAMNAKQDTAESRYFRFKWHKNGTIHILIKERRILDMINREIAEYYGAALAKRNHRSKAEERRGAACST